MRPCPWPKLRFVSGKQVCGTNHAFAFQETVGKAPRHRAARFPHKVHQLRRDTPERDRVKTLTVPRDQHAKSSITKMCYFFEHRIEYRRQVTRRRIDDLKNLGRRGLLFQSL